MKRSNLNFIIDVITFIGFVLLTTTGILMRYILPPGSGQYSTIWGLDRHQWGGVHFWVSIAFFSILTVHLALHWRWIISVVKGQPKKNSGFRVALGIVGLLAILALSMAPILTPIERQSAPQKTSILSSHIYEGISIRGSMTFNDVEVSTGVPASYIISTLKLPDSISVKQLGTLKRKYGIEINAAK